jgi:hypothetical protein
LRGLPLHHSGIATFNIRTSGKDQAASCLHIARYTEVWKHKDERWQLVASRSRLLPESSNRREERLT